MNAYKNASYVGFVLYLIGIIVIGYGLFNLHAEKVLDKTGIKTQGKVFDLMVIEPYRRAMVEFKDQNKKTIRFLDPLFWNHSFNKYKKGQQVEVIYDPDYPQKTAKINEFFQRQTTPWWPVIVGFMVFFVGWLMRRIMLKKAKAWDARM